MCLINYLSAFSSFVSSCFHFSHRHDCLILYHQTNWSTAGKSTREAPLMLCHEKKKKSIDSLPQSFLKYNTWRFSSAVLPSVGGLRRDPQAEYWSSYRLVLRIGLLRELMGPNYKTWVSLRSTRARIQGVDLDIHPPQNATKTKAPPYVGSTERGKKKYHYFFFPSLFVSRLRQKTCRHALSASRQKTRPHQWQFGDFLRNEGSLGNWCGDRGGVWQKSRDGTLCRHVPWRRPHAGNSVCFFLFVFFSRQISNEYSYCQSLLLAWLHPALFAII